MRTPSGILVPAMLDVGHVERMAHGTNAFPPDFIVQNKIAQARVAFEVNPEHVLCFALMPIGRMDRSGDAGNAGIVQRTPDNQVKLPAIVIAIKAVAKLPTVLAFLDEESRPRVERFLGNPFANGGQVFRLADHFGLDGGFVGTIQPDSWPTIGQLIERLA
jgi:hypothetical protein